MSLTRIPARTPRCELGWPTAERTEPRSAHRGPGANSLLPAVRLTRDFHKPASPGTDAPLKPELSTHCQFYSSFVNNHKHQRNKL